MLVYIDTNVYLNLLKNEKQAKAAETLFWRSYRCEFKIATSDHLFTELARLISPGEIDALLAVLKARDKIIKVRTEPLEQQQIKEYFGPNKEDYLHAILARKAKADLLITRNMKDFLPFRHLIEPKLPEDV